MEASKSKGYRTDILDLRKMNQPYLELIFGNMFSGKTSYLIEVYKMK